MDTFTGNFYVTVALNAYVSFWEDRGPNSYRLVSGDCYQFDGFDLERMVYLNGGGNSLVLPKDIQWLRIEKCDEITCLFDASLENAIHLKVCEVYNFKGMNTCFVLLHVAAFLFFKLFNI